jgi:hypothetical protein
VSAAELDHAALAGLDALAHAAELSVVLGAGASVAAGLPDWDTLAVRLLVGSGTVQDEATARAFLSRQDPALAAEAARAGAPDWNELVRRALYEDAEEPPEPTVLHLAVAGLAAKRPVEEVQLFTLNFDLVLETALRRALEEIGSTRGVYTRATPARAPRGDHEVHHLHGVVDFEPDGAQEVVLTLSDFTALSGSARPWQVSALQEGLQRGPMLLAGTSYRDPDLRQWLHELTQASGAGATSRLVVLLARQGLGLGREQFKRVQDALVNQWASIGVQATLTHDHSDAAQAVRELPFSTGGDYQPPQARAAALWAAHLDDFTSLQRQHPQELEDDLQLLRPHLGEGANLTLWVSDGRGQLVRWAAHDRMYRHPDHLRRVPTGHDSPWIAGQCLGRDDILARDLAETVATRRWRSVVAAPVVVDLPGGPPFSAAAVSSAIPEPLEGKDLDAWQDALTEVADGWSTRLAALVY